MKKIVDSICKNTLKLEDDVDSLKHKCQHTNAEKEDYQLKYSAEKEKYQKLQIDYETLEKDVEELFKIERKFNDMKNKQTELIQLLDKKDRKLIEYKPKIYELEMQNEGYRKKLEEYETTIDDLELELESMKELFRSEQNSDLQKKYQAMRSTMRASMLTKGNTTIRATNAISRLSQMY